MIDRVGKVRAMIPALGIYVVGLLLMAVVRDLVPLIGAGLVLMSGFILVSATVNASVRDHTPADRVGAVQGLRMVFFVLIPMVIGPSIGAAVIRGADAVLRGPRPAQAGPDRGDLRGRRAGRGARGDPRRSPCVGLTRPRRPSPASDGETGA